MLFFFFFFQAEDGIRDWSVTGVQTCALPIYFDPTCTEARFQDETRHLGPKVDKDRLASCGRPGSRRMAIPKEPHGRLVRRSALSVATYQSVRRRRLCVLNGALWRATDHAVAR